MLRHTGTRELFGAQEEREEERREGGQIRFLGWFQALEALDQRDGGPSKEDVCVIVV